MKFKSDLLVNDLKLHCRPANLNDRDFVLRLTRELIFKYVEKYYSPSISMFDERFRKDYRERTIIMRKSRRIGLFQLNKDGNQLQINGLLLSPFYQSKGIGSYLMGYFEEIAKQEKLKEIKLSVWENNPAVKFYKKTGYIIKHKKAHKITMVKKI